MNGERREIAALVPAAGYSSRMGKFKPLLPLGRSTVIQEAVERFRRAGVDDVRVIIGHRAEEIAPALEKLGVRKIFNPDYAKGMLSSILAGLKSLEPQIDAVFLLPADIPMVKPGTINVVAVEYRRSGAGIVYPCFEGLRGHPPLISKKLIEDLPGDCAGGLSAYLGRYEEQSVDLDVADQSILMDCDTHEDYRKLQAYGLREFIPTERECRALLSIHGASEELVAHSRMVAEVARTLAVYLKIAGFSINIDLVTASGLLHDLAKGQPDHAGAGAMILEKQGYERVARIVGLHTDLWPERPSLDEAGLVYLADKLVQGDNLVSLEKRFGGPLEKFAHRPEVLDAIGRRLKDARTIKRRVEKILGVSVESVLRKYEKSLRMASSSKRSIFLVRHGAVENPGNVKRYIGHTDLPLSADGVRQAEMLGEKLRHARLSAIYCSDLRRSVETALIIGKFHGLEPVAVRRFRELGLGEWEGLSFDEVRRRYPEEYEQRGRDFVNFRPPGAESFMDCACRVLPAFYEVLGSTRGNILIAGHAGVNRILLCQAMGKSLNDLFDFKQDYGCLNLIRYEDFAFELEKVNEF